MIISLSFGKIFSSLANLVVSYSDLSYLVVTSLSSSNEACLAISNVDYSSSKGCVTARSFDFDPLNSESVILGSGLDACDVYIESM